MDLSALTHRIQREHPFVATVAVFDADGAVEAYAADPTWVASATALLARPSLARSCKTMVPPLPLLTSTVHVRRVWSETPMHRHLARESRPSKADFGGSCPTLTACACRPSASSFTSLTATST